jgi:hypothetical protein
VRRSSLPARRGVAERRSMDDDAPAQDSLRGRRRADAAGTLRPRERSGPADRTRHRGQRQPCSPVRASRNGRLSGSALSVGYATAVLRRSIRPDESQARMCNLTPARLARFPAQTLCVTTDATGEHALGPRHAAGGLFRKGTGRRGRLPGERQRLEPTRYAEPEKLVFTVERRRDFHPTNAVKAPPSTSPAPSPATTSSGLCAPT